MGVIRLACYDEFAAPSGCLTVLVVRSRKDMQIKRLNLA
jgi:hypothetical protein